MLFFKKAGWGFSDGCKTNALLDFDFLLRSTNFGNLRTITQEGKKETRQMNQFFSFTFWALTVWDIHFCMLKLSKFIFTGSILVLIPNFGGESCEIRILSRSIQETIGHIYKFYMKLNFYKKVSRGLTSFKINFPP